MFVYRLCKKKHENDISGSGSIQYPGRWNLDGFRMLYTSETSSLSILEMAVHYKTLSKLIENIFLVIEIPEAPLLIRKLNSTQLPDKWDFYPLITETQEIGTKWLIDKQSLVLSVLSAVNPNERNILINPLHPEFKKIKIAEKRSYDLQSRFINRLFF